MVRVLQVFLLTGCLLILTACGGGDEAEPAAEELPATATPTTTVAPTPTATAIPTTPPAAQPASPLAAESPLTIASPLAGPEVDTYADPFVYCAAAGTIDAPDERYVGPDMPEVVAEGLRTALETPSFPLSELQAAMTWRCMDGQVYACSFGANLPCEEQADLSTEPSEAVQAYCEENPNEDFIPMVVTGRATVYRWACVDGEPVAGEPIAAVDEQGFLADIWYLIEE